MNKRGFTLIELIVVIALLSVIATIAVPRYFDMKEISVIKTDLYNSKNVIELARLEVTNFGEINGIKISDLTNSTQIDVIPTNFKYLDKSIQTQNAASLDSNRNYVLRYNTATKKFYVDDHGSMWPVIEGCKYYKCDWKGGYKYIDCTEKQYEDIFKNGYR